MKLGDRVFFTHYVNYIMEIREIHGKLIDISSDRGLIELDFPFNGNKFISKPLDKIESYEHSEKHFNETLGDIL